MQPPPIETAELKIALSLLRSELLPDLLHEINNPLTAIQNLLSLLRKPSAPADLRAEVIGAFDEAASQISQITRDAAAVSRYAAKSEFANLPLIIRQLIHLMSPRFRHASISIELADRLPQTAAMQRIQPQQALLLTYFLLDSLVVARKVFFSALRGTLACNCALSEGNEGGVSLELEGTISEPEFARIARGLESQGDNKGNVLPARLTTHFTSVQAYLYRVVQMVMQQTKSRLVFPAAPGRFAMMLSLPLTATDSPPAA